MPFFHSAGNHALANTQPHPFPYARLIRACAQNDVLLHEGYLHAILCDMRRV